VTAVVLKTGVMPVPEDGKTDDICVLDTIPQCDGRRDIKRNSETTRKL